MKNYLKVTIRMTLGTLSLFLLFGCGGGGGGSSSSDSGSLSGAQWLAQAAITQDGCGERISAVTQVFRFDGDQVDTGIVTIPVTSTSEGMTFGFSDTNGNCVRNYTAEFSSIEGDMANVKFVSASNCGGSTCENQWVGTATKIND